jgi:hypothetical protein
MSIFSGTNKTAAQITYEAILEQAQKLRQGEIARCKASFDLLWSGKTIEQCQAVLDLFGTSAMDLFIYHSAWQTFLATVDPTYLPLEPPFNFTINEDGTVTLSEKE